MNISINPTYFCNFACNFCYLTPKQLDDKKLISIEVLRERLQQVSTLYTIDKVDLYGGEIGLLPKSYITELKELFNEFNITDINIITNLSMVNDIILDDAFYLSVSYDFDCREKHELVFGNMFLISKPFSVLILASPCMMKKDPDEMIQTLNLISNIESVEIKPYSSNQSNSLNVTDDQYEEFVKKWIESPIEKNFRFTNHFLIKESLLKIRNSFSDDHVYITPTGNFAVLEFDENDDEYFLELQSMTEYVDWTKQEKEKSYDNSYCSSCEYFGHCLSEHIRNVQDLKHSCNGFKLLLDWYDHQHGISWKERQEIYHNNRKVFDDDLRNFELEFSDDIVNNAIRYFNDRSIGWVYPAKSYAVGICYAKWVSDYFGVDFYDALNDSELLFNNDPYYIPYNKDKETYDKIIEQITLSFDETKGMIPDIKKYFTEEFIIDEI